MYQVRVNPSRTAVPFFGTSYLVCPQNGTAVLEGLSFLERLTNARKLTTFFVQVSCCASSQRQLPRTACVLQQSSEYHSTSALGTREDSAISASGNLEALRSSHQTALSARRHPAQAVSVLNLQSQRETSAVVYKTTAQAVLQYESDARASP